MTGYRFGLALVAISLTLLGIVAIAQGRFSSSTSALAVGRINVTATRVQAVNRQSGPFGRQSNATEEAWRITDRFGTKIGRMLLQCRWITMHGRYCTGEISMPRGKIIVAGASVTRFEGEYAVTGGTGIYLGAGGVMSFQAIGIRKNVLLITVRT